MNARLLVLFAVVVEQQRPKVEKGSNFRIILKTNISIYLTNLTPSKLIILALRSNIFFLVLDILTLILRLFLISSLNSNLLSNLDFLVVYINSSIRNYYYK
ncbi:hypothetical protein JOL62DRAFT_556575 [Phyllosticta paracitricarpa]|uniref:Uncharacterized protein n=1 Tax=Phyllosticta paracitricarpa TaxID=2016321 RepID=A0ABR1N7P2_9PEZI